MGILRPSSLRVKNKRSMIVVEHEDSIGRPSTDNYSYLAEFCQIAIRLDAAKLGIYG